MRFKKGSKYTRLQVWNTYFPDREWSMGGNWATGYATAEDDLIIWMNIGVPGKTGHDFDNFYDSQKDIITWFGKPLAHSEQPTFQKLIKNQLTPIFFARYDNKDTSFLCLGEGIIESYENNIPCLDGNGKPSNTIKLKVRCSDSKNILLDDNPLIEPSAEQEITEFSLEKQLKSFLIENWDRTEIGQEYEFIDDEYPTNLGNIDILAKNENEVLIIELKRGRASDAVAGQLARYMGQIKDNPEFKNMNQRGIIISLDNDERIRSALSVIPNTSLYKYNISFSLERTN